MSSILLREHSNFPFLILSTRLEYFPQSGSKIHHNRSTVSHIHLSKCHCILLPCASHCFSMSSIKLYSNFTSMRNLNQLPQPPATPFSCLLYVLSLPTCVKPTCPQSAILMSLFLIGPGFIKGLPVIHGDSLCLYVHTLWINYFAQPF